MLWASGVSYATSACVDLGNSDIEAYVTNACSDGSATGAIDLQINDGTAEFEIYYYDASGHLLNPDNAEDVSGLLPGTYSIEVIDSKCAKAEMDVEVGTSDPIVISATLAPICQIGKGSISPTITGGDGDYSFVWSNGATTQNIENLMEGTYTLKVIDGNQCIGEQSFILSNSVNPFIFRGNLSKRHPTSCSSSDGQINAWQGWFYGGVHPMTFLWSTGATTNSISNLSAGTYTMTVTGADGCTGVKSEELEAQNDIKIEFEEIGPTCPNASEGYILLTTDQDVIFSCPQLGIAPDFNPDNPNTFELSNLASGEYCIGLEAINGTCKKEKCYQINDIPNEGPLNITGNITKSCKGKNNGNISIKVTGGYSQHPYSTTWSQNYTGSLNLPPGTYTVTVTDNCGTTASSSFVVTNFDYEPIKIESHYEKIDKDTYLVFNEITGGSGNFKYIWEYYSKYENNWKPHFHTKKDYKISLSKQYRITVIDKATGCSETKIYDCISTKEEVTNTCPGWEAGSIKIIPEYPETGLTYKWSNNSSAGFNQNLGKGTYTVTISSPSCSIVKSFTIDDDVNESQKPSFDNGCGLIRRCNQKSTFEQYDPIKHNGWIVDPTMKVETRKPVNCVDQEHFCPLVKREPNINPKIIKEFYPYTIYYQFGGTPDPKSFKDNCQLHYFCYTDPFLLAGIEYGTSKVVDQTYENGQCYNINECKAKNPNRSRIGEPFNLVWDGGKTLAAQSYCCPTIESITVVNLSKIEFYIKYDGVNGVYGNVRILGTPQIDLGTYAFENGHYSASIAGLNPESSYTLEIIFENGCPSTTKYFTTPQTITLCPEATAMPNPVVCGGRIEVEITNFDKINEIKGKIKLGNNTTSYTVAKASNNSPSEQIFTINAPSTSGIHNLEVTNDSSRCEKHILNLGIFVLDCPGIKDDCESEFLNITNNNAQNSFDTYWVENNVVKGAQVSKEDNLVKVNEKYDVSYTDHPIKTIKEDNIGNYISVSKYLNEIKKYNTNGNLIWQKEFQDFDILNISDDKTSNFNLVGFDNENFNYVSKTIDEDGNVIGENALSLPLKFYDILHQSGSTTTAYDKQENKLTFSTNSGNIEKSVPSGITVKDIKTLSSGNILVGGDFSGSINVAGEQFNSGEFKNAIFLTYSKSGNLLAGKPIIKARNETVKGIAVNDSNKAAYHGKYEEVVDISTNLIDSCVFIDIVDVGFCDTFPSILTYDHRTCQLTWDAAPSGYATALQMEVNGVWLLAEKALGIDVTPVSPYTITKDGKYRLLSKKEGCPDIISNIVQTSCTASCTCDVPLLSYSANNCQLTWANSCTSYTVSLQRLNIANIWETVVQQAVSPYNVQTNGQYRLYLSTSATSIGLVCPPVSSNTVTTSCTTSTNTCSCNAPTLSHNSTACTLTWSVSGCTGYTTTLQRSISGVWTSISASSPYTIPTGSNGQYRIITSKAGCTDVVSNIVNVTCSCSSPASITIFDYGTSGLGQNATIPVGQSYTHEVSQGAPDACDDSYIQLAFSSSVVNSSWNFYVNGTIAVMPGTVIGSQYVVDLYLPTPPSGGTADVFIQSPCGDFYQLHLVYDCETECPTFNLIGTSWDNYNYIYCYRFNIWSNIERTIDITYTTYYNGYDSNGNYFEIPEVQTISYQLEIGDNELEFCGPPLVDGNSYFMITYLVECEECNDCNLSGILGLLLKPIKKHTEFEMAVEQNDFWRTKEEKTIRFFPNPFSKGINLEMNSDIAESVALQAYNTVGTLMFERKIELLKGVNLRYIDAFENVPSGVYIVKIKSPTKDYTTKVIRVD